MYVLDYIDRNKKQFLGLCSRNHVARLFAFGSSVTDKFSGASSDIDLLVEIDVDDPVTKGDLLLNFLEEAEKFFNRRVDLLTDQLIRNEILANEVGKTKVLIYDREKQKVPA